MANKKHTFGAVLPDGRTVTRTTHREYSHVIAAKLTQKEHDRRVKWFGDQVVGKTPSWEALQWCGTPALAEKAERAAKKKDWLAEAWIVPAFLMEDGK